MEREHNPAEGRRKVEVAAEEAGMKVGRATVLTVPTHRELQLKAALCY